ncbi:citrate synthase/methylcitrate synthase [Thermotoga sp.]|uniref:citrate synthase/methylcitrate synthase n=1 Tax=Thermotoga sp. TaxID=28240 RepID=UPI002600759D|nr:citrate synthase/methylcitrate synthase [Thermotoga sp.]MCD6552362.1 citrate synthase/methylcitrate synthase [Thermotoga sp.]
MIQKGLEGVKICESSICFLDGVNGKLYYRGIPVEELAEKSSFEETAYLLWYGKLPTKNELEKFKEKMVEYRDLSDKAVTILHHLPRNLHYIDVLKIFLSIHGSTDGVDEDLKEKAIKIASVFPTILAYYYRYSRSEEPIKPRKDLSHVENFYYMMFGEKNGKVHLLESAFILLMEQDINASTFAALVIASTLSDLYSCIVGALGALKGPLHGGASEKVPPMLEEIESEDRVEEYVQKCLREKKKIMGFGHRVYKTYDPRAVYLKKVLQGHFPNSKLFKIASKLEDYIVSNRIKNIFPNVDLYSSILFEEFGFPRNMFTALFATARVVGWTAHVIEYVSDNKLIRPTSEYVGSLDVKYIPIERRDEDG